MHLLLISMTTQKKQEWAWGESCLCHCQKNQQQTNKKTNKTVVSWQNAVSPVAQCRTLVLTTRWRHTSSDSRPNPKESLELLLPQLSIKEIDWLTQCAFTFCRLLNASVFFFLADTRSFPAKTSLIILLLPLTAACKEPPYVQWFHMWDESEPRRQSTTCPRGAIASCASPIPWPTSSAMHMVSDFPRDAHFLISGWKPLSLDSKVHILHYILDANRLCIIARGL